MPNEPPTSPGNTRISPWRDVEIAVRHAVAQRERRLVRGWISSRPSVAMQAQAPRGSIVFAVTRETVKSSVVTCAEAASAASVPPASPRCHRKPILSGTSSQTVGAPDAKAAATQSPRAAHVIDHDRLGRL